MKKKPRKCYIALLALVLISGCGQSTKLVGPYLAVAHDAPADSCEGHGHGHGHGKGGR